MTLRERVSENIKAAAGAVRKHWAWVAAMIGIVLGGVGLYVALNPPRAESGEERALLESVPPKVAWHCHHVDPESHDLSPPITRLIRESVRCNPVDPGPEQVSFSSFATAADQARYMRYLSTQSYRNGYRCRSDYLGRGRWVDALGQARGELLCLDGSRHANLAWSDNQSEVFLVAIASTPLAQEAQLHHWWQRSVKYEGDEIPRQLRHSLTSSQPDLLGPCRHGGRPVPAALITATCAPGKGITTAGVALFADRTSLRQYIDAYARAFAPESGKKGCDDSTFSYTSWGNSPSRVAGDLLCFVSIEAQWFAWSDERALVFAYMARADEDRRKLWAAWSTGVIGTGDLQATAETLHDPVSAIPDVREVPVKPIGASGVGEMNLAPAMSAAQSEGEERTEWEAWEEWDEDEEWEEEE